MSLFIGFTLKEPIQSRFDWILQDCFAKVCQSLECCPTILYDWLSRRIRSPTWFIMPHTVFVLVIYCCVGQLELLLWTGAVILVTFFLSRWWWYDNGANDKGMGAYILRCTKTKLNIPRCTSSGKVFHLKMKEWCTKFWHEWGVWWRTALRTYKFINKKLLRTYIIYREFPPDVSTKILNTWRFFI